MFTKSPVYCSHSDAILRGSNELTLVIRDMGPATWTRALIRAFTAAESRIAVAEARSGYVVPETTSLLRPQVCHTLSCVCLIERRLRLLLRENDFHRHFSQAWPWVIISGPVGRPSVQLERYDHIILVAGGIGITAIAPIFAAAASGRPLGPSPGGPLTQALSCIGLAAPPLHPSGGAGSLLARGGSLSLLWVVSRKEYAHFAKHKYAFVSRFARGLCLMRFGHYLIQLQLELRKQMFT